MSLPTRHPDRDPVGADSAPAPRPTNEGGGELSAMAPRFNLFVRGFARRFFRHIALDEPTVARLRDLESQGAVVYVMRYASRLDYFLFNALFLREGLRLSRFANGIRFYYYRPIFEALRIAFTRPRSVSHDVVEQRGHRPIRS